MFWIGQTVTLIAGLIGIGLFRRMLRTRWPLVNDLHLDIIFVFFLFVIIVVNSVLCLFPILSNAQEKTANPVVPNGTLGPFRHGTFPSLESKGQQWTHIGVDLVAAGGSPVYAFGDGTVIEVITQNDPEFSWAGNAVMVEHPTAPKKTYTIYLHLKETLNVKTRDPVQGGKTQIGRVGHTGAANNVDHVHFEIRYFKEWLSRWGNIYAPGDQRNSPYLKTNWEDPAIYFLRFPSGMRLEERTAGATPQSPPQPAPTAASPTTPTFSFPIPTSYGVYLISASQLFELRPERAETRLVWWSTLEAGWAGCCFNGPHPRTDDRSVRIIVFLKGLEGAKAVLREFEYVRRVHVIALDRSGRTATVWGRPLKDKVTTGGVWAGSREVPLKTSPVPGQPEMILAEPAQDTTAGLYGFRIDPSTVGSPLNYPQQGFLMFWDNFHPNDTTSKCADWRVEDWYEFNKVQARRYECSNSPVAEPSSGARPSSGQGGSGVQGGGSKDTLSASAPPPSPMSAGKGRPIKEVLEQIAREDQTRISRYPADIQRWIAQRSKSGKEAMRAQDWKRALNEYIVIARTYDPQNFEASVNLSGIYAMLNDVGNAKKHFEVANRRAPDYAVPYVNMVYAYARTGNIDEALMYLEKVVELGYDAVGNLGKDSDLPKEFREHPKVQQLLAKGN